MYKNLNPAALGVSGHQSELIELALTFGFKGMDLNMAEFATRARAKGLDYAKRLIQSAKLRVSTFALPVALEADEETYKRDFEKIAEYAGYAAALGCTRATVLVAPAGDARPYHENFEFHRGRLLGICGALQPHGVRLALGFQAAEYLRKDQAFQFIHDLDATMTLINMVAAPNLGLLADTWDIAACGADVEAIRKIPAGQIVAVRVADMPADVSAADLNGKSRLLPGGETGRIDVAGFLSALRELGYDGPVTAKLSREAFQSRRRDVIVKQTSEALDRVLQPQAAVAAA